MKFEEVKKLLDCSPVWTKGCRYYENADRTAIIELDGEDIILNGKRMPICEFYEKDGVIYHKEIEGFHAAERDFFTDNGGGNWIEVSSS